MYRYYTIGFLCIFCYNFAVCLTTYAMFTAMFGLVFHNPMDVDVSVTKFAALESIFSVFRDFAMPVLTHEGKKFAAYSVTAGYLFSAIIAVIWVNASGNTYVLLPVIFASQIGGDFFALGGYLYGVKLLRL